MVASLSLAHPHQDLAVPRREDVIIPDDLRRGRRSVLSQTENKSYQSPLPPPPPLRNSSRKTLYLAVFGVAVVAMVTHLFLDHPAVGILRLEEKPEVAMAIEHGLEIS